VIHYIALLFTVRFPVDDRNWLVSKGLTITERSAFHLLRRRFGAPLSFVNATSSSIPSWFDMAMVRTKIHNQLIFRNDGSKKFGYKVSCHFENGASKLSSHITG